MESEILTLDEAAAALKVAPEAVELLLVAGDVAGRHIGGEWRTTLRALVCYVEGVSLESACCPPGTCCTPDGQSAQGGGGCC